MGGEYLPGYRRNEVEIVRIELDSTTSDVISLRARPIGRKRPRIVYTLVDEHQTEYGIRPAQSVRPLTLGQLITLLDDVDTDVSEREWLRHGWVLSLNESNRTLDNGDPEPYRDFTRVLSEAITGRLPVECWSTAITFRVGEQRFHPPVCLEQIAAHDQRRAEDGPQRQQRTLFVAGETRIARLAPS